MPTVEIHLIEGYDADAKTRLGHALTDAVQLVVPAPPEAVAVMMHDMAPANYMRGRTSRIPAPALPDPVEVIKRYLAATEARDQATASGLLAPDFTMCFPGGVRMTSLVELVEWAAPRYRSITKTIVGFDLGFSDGATVVHCRGTLAGIWPDGTGFSGIRFADRFELRGGLITRQDVWNDLAETGGLR